MSSKHTFSYYTHHAVRCCINKTTCVCVCVCVVFPSLAFRLSRWWSMLLRHPIASSKPFGGPPMHAASAMRRGVWRWIGSIEHAVYLPQSVLCVHGLWAAANNWLTCPTMQHQQQQQEEQRLYVQHPCRTPAQQLSSGRHCAAVLPRGERWTE